MKYKCVITSHTNPTLSGVAKFNDILARMLSVPCLGIDETYQQKQGPVLISVKLGEGIFSVFARNRKCQQIPAQQKYCL